MLLGVVGVIPWSKRCSQSAWACLGCHCPSAQRTMGTPGLVLLDKSSNLSNTWLPPSKQEVVIVTVNPYRQETPSVWRGLGVN